MNKKKYSSAPVFLFLLLKCNSTSIHHNRWHCGIEEKHHHDTVHHGVSKQDSVEIPRGSRWSKITAKTPLFFLLLPKVTPLWNLGNGLALQLVFDNENLTRFLLLPEDIRYTLHGLRSWEVENEGARLGLPTSLRSILSPPNHPIPNPSPPPPPSLSLFLSSSL